MKIPKDIEHKKIMHLFHRIQKAISQINLKILIIWHDYLAVWKLKPSETHKLATIWETGPELHLG